MDDLKKQLADCQKQIDDLTISWKRALADYQNLEKRIAQNREELTKYSTQKLIKELLSVLDTLEKADEHLKDQGLDLAVGNFQTILKANGVKKIEVMGKKFDPEMMECTEVIPSDKDDTALEEVRRGYMLWDKVLRPVQVKVGKKIVDEGK
ncbi:nucleotide exchange factor GrpE [Candidatus Gottesmanbacteria bacterium]|nr:nucleotide exchange factor GrpE [Candidatus Gottesmanbacteria bacterium]